MQYPVTMRKLLIAPFLGVAITCLLFAAPVNAADATGEGIQAPSAEHLQVTDPFVEMHTGPGRGFPVFFVVPRDQWIALELRHTDWFKVRAQGGQVGWVQRSQLQTTLTAAGDVKSFRDILLDDYLKRHLQVGAAWGQFKSEPMLKFWTSYRLSETLSAEATLGQVQGVFSGTDFWHVNVISEPWSDQRVSPFFGIGLGKFRNLPNQSLVDAAVTDAQLANATAGVRYYINDRFVLRGDYTIYTAFVSDTRTIEYRALTAGMSFFF